MLYRLVDDSSNAIRNLFTHYGMKPFSNIMYGAAMQESVPFGA